MKKDSLLKMKDLPATEEMLAVAREDVPVKVGSGWNTFYRCRYSGFVRGAVEGGILKVTLYDPDAMRLGGTLPVYEIFMEKEKQQFLTYDRSRNEWRAAKIDYLEWQAKGSNNVWISAVDDEQIRQYLASDEKSVYRAILKFQRAVRDAELERRHRKETDPWDAELSQTPPLPKDWERWVNKVGIQENYIFYDYRKGGARYGYCTYCEKEVALKQRPYFDRQNDDLKDAEQFLKEWQKVVSERLTESDREKAEKSKVLRLQEFEQLRQDDIRIHTGDLAGQRLVDVLVSDLMETVA